MERPSSSLVFALFLGRPLEWTPVRRLRQGHRWAGQGWSESHQPKLREISEMFRLDSFSDSHEINLEKE